MLMDICLASSPFRPKLTAKISNFVKNYRTTIKPRSVKGQVIRQNTAQYIFCDHKADSVFIGTSVKWTCSMDGLYRPQRGTSGQAASPAVRYVLEIGDRMTSTTDNDFWIPSHSMNLFTFLDIMVRPGSVDRNQTRCQFASMNQKLVSITMAT